MKKTICALVFLIQANVFALTTVRVGWQIPWSIQGQIISIFKKTDILKKNGIAFEYIGRRSGPELNELAMANEVDLILTADQPAAVLFSKDKGWVGISRLMYNRTATYVPTASKIKSMADLKNKIVGVPFGAAAQRIAYRALEDIKLNPTSDVQFKNLGMTEQFALVKASNEKSEKWDSFDAFSGFDPLPAKLETENKARLLHEGKVVALIVAKEDFLIKNKKIGQAINTSLIEAYEYYRDHVEEVNTWYIDDSKIPGLNDSIFKISAKFEPNLIKENKINIHFSEDDFKIMDEASVFVEKTVGKKVDMKKYVSNKYIAVIKNKGLKK